MSQEPVPIRPAATIMLVRDEPAFEVLMVKRHHQIDFVPGAMVFPGGKTHAGDHDPSWAGRCDGWAMVSAEERPLRIAAIREAYEETGLLIARDGENCAFAGHELAVQARDAIARDQRQFLDLVKELDLRLDLRGLTPFARWITPAMMPKRFDTWFYIAAAPLDQLAAHDGWETVDSEWVEPAEVLRMGAAGERKVIFPTRMNLQLLAESSSAAEATARAAARTLVTVEPRVQQRADGGYLVIPADAGYGHVEESLANLRD